MLDVITRGELSLGSRPVYLVRIQDEKDEKSINHGCCNQGVFHFCTWLGGNPEVTQFQVISSFKSVSFAVDMRFVQLDVAFGRKQDADDFRQWFGKLKKKFQPYSTDEFYIPPLPSSGTMRLSFVEHNFQESYGNEGGFSIDRRVIEAWTWIAHNTKRPVYRTNKGFAFASQREAAAYILWKPTHS